METQLTMEEIYTFINFKQLADWEVITLYWKFFLPVEYNSSYAIK